MKAGWNEVPLSRAPLEIIDGDRGKAYPKQADFSDDEHCLFLNATNVTTDGFEFSDCQFITEQKDAELRKGKLTRNDVVLTTRGTLGNTAYYNDNVPYEHVRINSGMVIMRADATRLHPAYLYGFLRSPSFQKQVEQLRSGVAQPQLPIRDINTIKMSFPVKTSDQMRIVVVFSAYDDLIENNRRRIALLEESARQLYQEWFVRLRFPGYEHSRITKGVPEGWEKKRLSDVAEINKEMLPSSFDGEIDYIDISSVTPGSINETTHYDYREAPSRARRVVRHGDIIWSCVRPNRKSYAVIWQPLPNLIASTGFAVITPTAIPTTYLLQATTTDLFVGYLENHARGAAYPAVVAGDFERAEILVPNSALVRTFNEQAEPLLAQAHALSLQNQKLRAARDLLLPRLMSGEIAV